jgi:hypothetical protein
MNTKDSSVVRELKADELEKVSGGFVVPFPRPPVGPAFDPTLYPPMDGNPGGGGGCNAGAPHCVPD